MVNKVTAKSILHLREIIDTEINQYGWQCDLNHIDLSNITDINFLFFQSQFNGDISQWDVSNVTDMSFLFYQSEFTGDISKWNVSKVKDMRSVFFKSKFNGDISAWDVSNVTNMSCLFYKSQFTGDLSSWKPINLRSKEYIFKDYNKGKPYWSYAEDAEEIRKIIECYQLAVSLENLLKEKVERLKQTKL